MIKRKKNLAPVIVGGVFAVLCFTFLILSSRIRFGDMVQEYVNTDIYSVLEEKNVVLGDEEKVCQEFVSRRGSLHSFSLKIVENEKLQNEILKVTLKDGETGEVVQIWNKDKSTIEFDGYCEFVLDNVLYGVQNKLFVLEIEADSDGYILGGTESDTLKGGTLYIADAAQEGDLAIKISTESSVWITLFYGVLFCVLLGGLVGGIIYFAPQKKIGPKLRFFKKNLNYRKIAEVAIGTVFIILVGIGVEKILFCSGIVFRYMQGDFNEYRCAFLIIGLLLIFYMVKFRDYFEEEPEKLFLLSFILIGFLFVISMPGEAEISWDESIHYWRAVGVSHALDGRANYAEGWLYWHSGIGYTLPNSIASLRGGQMNIQSLYNMGLEVSADTSILSDWSMLVYLPSAIGLAIGRILGLPYVFAFHMGAAMNMLVYTTALYYAMKRLSSGKMILAAIGGIPVSMFLASVYSYDSWVVAFSILGTAYFIGCMQDGKVSGRDMAVMLISFSLAFVPKEIYFPLFLLFLLLPKGMFETEKRYIQFCITVLALFCTFGVGMVIGLPYVIAAFFIFWLGIYSLYRLLAMMSVRTRILVVIGAVVVVGIFGIIIVYKILPQMLGRGDLRGGDTVNSAAQARFIMENPVEYTIILLRFLKNQYLAFQVEVQGLFNTFGYIGKSSFAVISFVGLWIVAFTDKKNADIWKRYNITRIVVIIISFITVCLVATGLYVAFTPVGLDTVQGCQIRYAMPIVFPFFAFIGFNRIQNNMKAKYYNAIVISAIDGLLLLNLWEVVIRYYS